MEDLIVDVLLHLLIVGNGSHFGAPLRHGFIPKVIGIPFFLDSHPLCSSVEVDPVNGVAAKKDGPKTLALSLCLLVV